MISPYMVRRAPVPPKSDGEMGFNLVLAISTWLWLGSEVEKKAQSFLGKPGVRDQSWTS